MNQSKSQALCTKRLESIQVRHSLVMRPSLTRGRALQTFDCYRCGRGMRRLAQRLQLALLQADELEAQTNKIVEARYVPLTKLCGVSLVTAGTLAAILGSGNRFKSDAQLAAYAGVAPLETSSAGHVRHRLNRGETAA